MTNKRYDELFAQIVSILRRDHAWADRIAGGFDPRYYHQAVGQAWHDDRLDELLFLRYMNQMLACTGDRHLRLDLRPSDTYTPWSPGFFTRRFENSLYVTAAAGEPRLSVGDRIIAVNGGAPAAHRAGIQKNFFYADEPEREDWNGLLKMADSVTVARPDGSEEELFLERRPRESPCLPPELKPLAGGVLYLRPAPFDGEGRTAALLSAHEAELSACRGLVVDMRAGQGEDEDECFALLPWVCRRDTPLAELIDTEFYVNYTRLNCILRAAGLENVPGGEAYIAELREKAGSGLTPETDRPEDTVSGRAPERVAVLTDTWCRDAGESFVLAAKRAGAYLIGRPTLGTSDFCGDVHYALDGRYTLTWPTAVTKAARDGRGVMGRGAAPDRYIPWTPAECETDVVLDAAAAYMENGK